MLLSTLLLLYLHFTVGVSCDLTEFVCRYKTSREEDDAVVADPRAGPREKVAARLLRIEKSILSGAQPFLVVILLLYILHLLT